MENKYFEFAYYDGKGEMQCVKYKRPLRIRFAIWLYIKLLNYAYNATIRDRRRRYARYMRKHK